MIRWLDSIAEGLVSEHIGVDHSSSLHSLDNVDLIGTEYETGVRDASVDTVLCTSVLEHLERPQDAINEIRRVLRPGGCVILTTNVFWHLHEEPRDFFRYTNHELVHVFTSAGLEIVDICPHSGFVVTFGQELCYYHNRLRMRFLLRVPTVLLQTSIQAIAYCPSRLDRSYEYSVGYLVIARKPGGAANCL
jgi:SAM-dependent methyltransferase